MQRTAFICAALLVCGGHSAAGAQDSLQTVKALYASAAYEDALVALNRVEAGGESQLQQYRVFCLVALGRQGEADKAMDALIAADPLYVFDPVETSPRVQDAFNRRRQQLLPDVAKRSYSEARAALDRKERAAAIGRFERLLTIIDAVQGAPASLSELRVLASGFLDLSRALPEPAAAPVRPIDKPPAVVEAVPAPREIVETRPVPLKQDLPVWVPPDAVSRRTEYNGAVAVKVQADGRVSSASIVKGIHPVYDAALLRAARTWMYEPARRNDVPISADLTIEVNLRPPD